MKNDRSFSKLPVFFYFYRCSTYRYNCYYTGTVFITSNSTFSSFIHLVHLFIWFIHLFIHLVHLFIWCIHSFTWFIHLFRCRSWFRRRTYALAHLSFHPRLRQCKQALHYCRHHGRPVDALRHRRQGEGDVRRRCQLPVCLIQ